MAENYEDNTEFDFKDLNTAFLKRPAVVSIKKPFLTNEEMTDVLTRLLVKFVPPKYGESKYSYRSGYGDIRAVVRITPAWIDPEVRAEINAWSSELEEKSRGKIFSEIFGSDKDGFKILRRIQSTCLLISNKETLVAGSSKYSGAALLYKKHTNSKTYSTTKEKQEYTAFNSTGLHSKALPRSGSNFELDTGVFISYEEMSEINEENFIKYYPRFCQKYEVFLLNPQDHEDFKSGPKRFSDCMSFFFPSTTIIYAGQPALLYSKTKPSELSDSDFNRLFPKSTLGNNIELIAQKWEFRVPVFTPMPEIKTIEYYAERYGLKRSTRLNTIKENCKKMLSLVGDNMRAGKKHAPDALENATALMLDEKKEVNERKKGASQTLNFINMLYGYADKRTAKSSTIASFGTTPASFNQEYVTDIDSQYFQTKKELESDDLFYPYIIKSYPEFSLFNCDYDYNSKFIKSCTSNVNSQQSFNYLTTDIDPNDNKKCLSELGFRFLYYTVLFNKLTKKFGIDGVVKANREGTYKKFLDSHTMQCPLMPDILECKKYLEIFKDKAGDSIITKIASFEKEKEFIDFITKMERILFSPLSGVYITSVSDTVKSVTSPIWNSQATEQDFEQYRKVINEYVNSTDALSKWSPETGELIARTVLACENKDVETINITRVVSGTSSASVVLKNDQEKYSFTPTDSPLDNDGFCISPMDQISIFLPDLEGNLNKVFSGVVSKVTEENQTGYHSLAISAECNLKYLKVNRTNVKPSVTRTENEQSIITPFIVPKKFYNSVEQFLPFIFAQSLSYIQCQPASRYNQIGSQEDYLSQNPIINVNEKTTQEQLRKAHEKAHKEIKEAKENIGKLFTKSKVKLKATVPVKVTAYIAKDKVSTIQVTQSPYKSYATGEGIMDKYRESLPKYGFLGTQRVYIDTPKVLNTYTSDKSYSIEDKQRDIDDTKVVIPVDVLVDVDMGAYTTVQGTRVVGSFERVHFNDPLYNYLWYKAVSRYPEDEVKIIEDSLNELLKDYVYTGVITDKSSTDFSTGQTTTPNTKNYSFAEEKAISISEEQIRLLKSETETGIKRFQEPGVIDLHTALKEGKRCTYLVYKQRCPTLIDGGTGHELEDRELVAQIDGTSQPVYSLQGSNLSIQFSVWKTNMQLISEIADKFNFLCYSTNNGVIRFAPYNFDLLALNTRNFSTPINASSMLEVRDTRALESDDNPLILKRKYITRYNKTEDDSRILNWVRLTGNFNFNNNNAGGLMTALVTDPVLIKKYGVRAAPNKNIMGITNSQSLLLYGLAWLDRQNKRFRAATISGLYDSRMEINTCYFVPHDSCIYYCESLDIMYKPGDTCTYTMGATYGKKPLIKLPMTYGAPTQTKIFSSEQIIPYDVASVYVGETSYHRVLDIQEINKGLDSLFLEKNEINPTVYAQYKRLFARNVQHAATFVEKNAETTTVSDEILLRNASICCYNGYLWDNVSGISFEELVYNYGFIMPTGWVNGFTTIMGIENAVDRALIEEMTMEYGVAVSDTVLHNLASAFRYVPGKFDTNNLPDYFRKQHYNFSDLNVPGIFEINENDSIMVLDMDASNKEKKKAKKNT